MVQSLKQQGVSRVTRMNSAKGQGSTAFSGILAVAQGFLNEAERRRRRFVEKGDAGELHRYRVAVRRARSAMGAGKGAVKEQGLASCRRRLAAAMTSSNRLRDLDVKCVDFPLIAKEMPKSLRGGVQKFLKAMRLERERELTRVRQLLARVEVQGSLEGVRCCADAPECLSGIVHKRTKKLLRGIIFLSNELNVHSKEDCWHAIRIEGKKARYLIESFGDFFPKRRAEKAIKALERLQEVLGKLNDNTMQKLFLRDPMWKKLSLADPELARCLGGIEVLLEQRSEMLRRDAARVLECFRTEGAEALRKLT